MLLHINMQSNLPVQQQREYYLSWQKSGPHPSAAGQTHSQFLQRNVQCYKGRKVMVVIARLIYFIGNVIGWHHVFSCCNLLAHFEEFTLSTSTFHCCRPSNMLTRFRTVWLRWGRQEGWERGKHCSMLSQYVTDISWTVEVKEQSTYYILDDCHLISELCRSCKGSCDHGKVTCGLFLFVHGCTPHCPT